MRRLLFVAVVCTVPALMFLNAWQVYRFDRALDDIRDLEQRQRSLIEENKNALVGIEVLSSPARLEEIAGGMDKVQKRLGEPRVLIRIGEHESPGGAGNDLTAVCPKTAVDADRSERQAVDRSEASRIADERGDR